jgi:hypothetical protein
MTLDWRDRRFWLRIGYILTFIWVVAIYEITGGERSHPLSHYIFLAPLGAWVAALIVARIIISRSNGPKR